MDIELLIEEVHGVIEMAKQTQKQAKAKPKGDDKDDAKELQKAIANAKEAAQREKDKK